MSSDIAENTDALNPALLSLGLNLTLMTICLLAIYFIYLAIKHKSIENENIDKLIDLGKWFIISVAIVLSTSTISDVFKQRELAMKELELKYKIKTEISKSHMEDFERYTDIVLAADLEKKRFLSDYFANVAIGERKAGWEKYNQLVRKDIEKLKEADKTVNNLGHC